MKKKVILEDKPNLPKRLFWEFRYDEMDWRDDYLTVMERVIERGSPEEWEEMIRFYGRPAVVQAVKSEIKFLADYAIEKACVYSSLTKEDLLCYHRKLTRKGYWI